MIAFRKVFSMYSSFKEICVDTVMSEENGKELEAIKVFQYSIQYLKDHLVETVRKTFNDITEDDIRWVITVPAIWNDSAKKFMRQAANQVSFDSGVNDNAYL